MNVQKQTTLEQAFNFTPDDLRENQQGRLSATQAAYLRHIAQRMALIIIGVLGGLGILTIISAQPDSSDLAGFFLFLIVPAAIVLAVTVGATEMAIAPKVVASRTGTAHMAYGMFGYDPPVETQQRSFMPRYGTAGGYRMIVGDTKFGLNREQWSLIPPGAQIAIYFLPTIHKILAIEILDPNIRLAEPPSIDITAEPMRPVLPGDDDGDTLKG
jgi:hypothetical protein